jgi:tetratricopeptide (TPR) repeat protein
MRINPDYPLTWENRGRLRLRMGQFDKSLEDADRAVALETASPAAHRVRECGLMKLGRFEEAARECKAVLQLDPESADARGDFALALSKLTERALTLTNAGRYPQAIGACESVLALDPGSADAHKQMAFALDKLGRHDEAIAQLKEALASDPNNSTVRDNLARLTSEEQAPAAAPAGVQGRTGP